MFYQNLVPDRRIGFETIDPGLFTGSPCPPGDECRWSDSLFIHEDQLVPRDQGRIARPEAPGLLTIDHLAPQFRIVAEAGPLMVGTFVDKVGRTTGWTAGHVTIVCQDYTFDVDKRLLCQNAGTLHAATGDSGFPVFLITNTPAFWDVEIVGLLWGRVGDPPLTTFSDIGLVFRDLGLHDTWDICDPAFAC